MADDLIARIETLASRLAEAKASGCFAVAMDVDAAGLPFLKNMTPPAGSKSVEELAEIVQLAERPFIVKGVMTVKGALKAKQAGAAAIVVSNHGGRVLDQCPATAEVLPAIPDAVGGKMTILVGGGTFRSDNPQLTVRGENAGQQPLACVLTSRLPQPDADFHLLKDRPEQTVFMVSPAAAASTPPLLRLL